MTDSKKKGLCPPGLLSSSLGANVGAKLAHCLVTAYLKLTGLYQSFLLSCAGTEHSPSLKDSINWTAPYGTTLLPPLRLSPTCEKTAADQTIESEVTSCGVPCLVSPFQSPHGPAAVLQELETSMCLQSYVAEVLLGAD